MVWGCGLLSAESPCSLWLVSVLCGWTVAYSAWVVMNWKWRGRKLLTLVRYHLNKFFIDYREEPSQEVIVDCLRYHLRKSWTVVRYHIEKVCFVWYHLGKLLAVWGNIWESWQFEGTILESCGFLRYHLGKLLWTILRCHLGKLWAVLRYHLGSCELC